MRTLPGKMVIGALASGFAVAACRPTGDRGGVSEGATSAAPAATDVRAAAPGASANLIYGRVTTEDGVVREGRLRWGGDQEALWSNFFNGAKSVNPWIEYAPKERSGISVFGKELIGWEREPDARRPFMARFGDIARIELRGKDIQVLLKSGTVFHIARYGADDMNDGVRVWNDGGFSNVSEWGIRTIEFLPAPLLRTADAPLYGTVRTRAGDFTGLIQWNRRACLMTDELGGIVFDSIASIVRRGNDSSLVTLTGGGRVLLGGTGATARSGIYVDDERYGRVLVSWDAFERVDFVPATTVHAYADFHPGHPIRGDVVTRSGRRLSGRLVFDLDESETTETLDAPSRGVDYMIPFGGIASIVPGDGTVTLATGEVLHLERAGDLHSSNGGMLVFIAGRNRPEHVPWAEVERVEFQRP